MRKRNIFAKREILASDINNVSDYLQNDMTTVIKDIMAVSSGVINGLAITTSVLNYTISAGKYSDGTTYYELLNNFTGSVSTAGTYKVYIQLSTIDDTPTSGYLLLDTLTRLESFDVVNSRTIDIITVGATTGTMPLGAIQIGTLVSDGSSITSTTDTRTFVTFGNLVAYSLQNFSQTAKNIAYRTNKITGYIYDETDSSHNIFGNVTISNSHAGYGFKVNTGNNSGAIGYLANNNNNIAFKAISSGTGGTSFDSTIGSTNTSFNGLSSSKTSTTGLKLDGYHYGINTINSDIGLRLIDNTVSIYAENTNHLATNGYLAKYIANSVESPTLDGKINQWIQSSGAITAQQIEWIGTTTGSVYLGTNYINNNANDNTSYAINIDNTSGVSKFTRSINIDGIGDVGLIIDKKSTNTGIPLFISNSLNTGASSDNLSAIISTSLHSVGLNIIKNDASAGDSMGIAIGSLDGGNTDKFDIGLRLRNTNTASIGITDFSNDAIKIVGTNVNTQYGLNIDAVWNGIKVNNTNNANGGVLCYLNGKDTTTNSTDGLYITNTFAGLSMTNSARAIKVDNFTQYGLKLINGSISGTSIAIDIEDGYSGIYVKNMTNFGLNLDTLQQIKLTPSTSGTPTALEGHLVCVSETGVTKLKFYANGSWTYIV